MKKIILLMILGVLLVASIGLVFALGNVTVATDVSGAIVEVNGESFLTDEIGHTEVISLEAGTYTFIISKGGYDTRTVEYEIKEGIIHLLGAYLTAIEEECIENWECTEWSECAGYSQTRTCTDSNNCGNTIKKIPKPDEGQNCNTCSSNNLGLCPSEFTCENAGGFWYNSVCNVEEEPVNVCSSDNLNLCTGQNECTNAGGFWYNSTCNEEDEDNETGEGNQGLGQVIRKRVKAGVYTSPTGEQIRVRELAQNRFLLQVNNISADCECELEEETENNRTKLKAKLSNGRKAEIKIMPDVASKRALERLRLKVCSADNNCTIELKEVGSGNKIQLAYELQAERHSKLLWMFRKKMQVKAQIDSETGDIIRIKKPWWAFLAAEPEE